jgi:midasin (ATPase involved in ribosome maturation)
VFYSQFSGPVATRLQNLRTPLEKKLKEAVKIARWTDTNYWALRMSVEKTHRILFRHMRDFQDILAQNASPAMNIPAVVLAEWNLPLDDSDFVSTIRPDVSQFCQAIMN